MVESAESLAARIARVQERMVGVTTAEALAILNDEDYVLGEDVTHLFRSKE